MRFREDISHNIFIKNWKMLRAFIIELFIQRLGFTFFSLLLFLVFIGIVIGIWIFNVNGSIIIWFFLFWFGLVIGSSFLWLSWFLLERLNRFWFRSTADRWNCTYFFLVLSDWFSGWRRIIGRIASCSESFYLFIDHFCIIIVLSFDSFLFSFFQAAYLNRNAFESVDFIFDIFGKVIIFIFNCSFLLQLKFLYTCHRLLIHIKVGFGSWKLLMNRR